MNNSDKQLRDAFSSVFDEIKAPERLKKQTLQAIEAKRAEVIQHTEAKDTVDAKAAVIAEATVVTKAKDVPIIKTEAKTEARAEARADAHSKKQFGIIFSIRAKIALAACAVLIALGVGGAYAYTTPTAYVGIDVNPSIELGLNCFDRVVSAEGLNQDGQKVLDAAKVTGMSYNDALRQLSASLETDGFLDSESAVAVTVMCDDKQRCSNLEQISQNCFATVGQGVHCSRASSEEHNAAHEAGMCMGKYQVWRALADAGVDISAEEASTMTMTELRNLATQEGADSAQGSGHHKTRHHGE